MKFDFIQNMRRSLSLLAVIVASLFASETLSAESMWTDEGNYDISWYKEGQTEFQINNEREFAGLAYLVNSGNGYFYNCKIYLNSDIQLDGHLWIPIGNSSSTMHDAEIDGQNHVISGMTIDCSTLTHFDSNTIYAGLFGRLAYCPISNLKLKDSEIFTRSEDSRYYYVGTVVASGARITNVQSEGKIRVLPQTKSRSLTIGGIAGSGTTVNCEFSGAIISAGDYSSHIGGVVGEGSANRCINRASINHTGVFVDLGGVLGSGNGDYKCLESYNYGNITVIGSGDTAQGYGYYSKIGGVLGGEDGMTLNCGNYGNISVEQYSDFEGSNTLNLAGITPSKAYNSFNYGNIYYKTTNAGSLEVGSGICGYWWVIENLKEPLNCLGVSSINGGDKVYTFIDKNVTNLTEAEFIAGSFEEILNNTAIELTKNNINSQTWERHADGNLYLSGRTLYALDLNGGYISNEIKPWWSQVTLGSVTVGKACFIEGETVNVSITPVEGYKLRKATLQYYDPVRYETVYQDFIEPEFSFAMPPYNCTLTCDMEAGSGIDDINADVDGNVTVYNLAGQELYRGEIEQANLAPGVYIVKSASSVKKIIVK